MIDVVINKAVFQSDWTGRVIDGRFPLLEQVGSTGPGAVFRTELTAPQPRRAAIRLIPSNAEGAQTIIGDWAAATTLSHPHLMRFYHTGRCQFDNDELVYAVTEYAEEDLSQVLPGRPLTPVETREMLEPVLNALSYVHGKGMAYGHLETANITVVDDKVKLPIDGLHRVGRVAGPNAEPGIYDAPEIADGAVSPASDIWSLGAILVEALTQRPPAWERGIKRDPVVPETIPQPFAEIARKCLRLDPEQRCGVSDIQTLLDPTRSQPGAGSETSEAMPPRIAERASDAGHATPAKRNVAMMIAAAVVLLLIVAVLVLRPHRTQNSPPAEQRPGTPAAAAPLEQKPAAPTQTSGGATAKGEVNERVMPEVAPSAIRTIHGKFEVRIRVTVSQGGDVSNAVIESRGPSRYFARQALEAARRWKFKPPQADGKPLSSEWMLRFEFRGSGTDVTPIEVSP